MFQWRCPYVHLMCFVRYQTRAGVTNPWGVPHRSNNDSRNINSSITQQGERLSVTTTTSTLTICRPIPIRPWPIYPTLPITTSTTITSITRPTPLPPLSSLSSSSLSHVPRFIYSPPTPHTGQISFTPSTKILAIIKRPSGFKCHPFHTFTTFIHSPYLSNFHHHHIH